MIKEIISDKELSDSVEVIRESFRTVAEEFNLTPRNCPTHPSFITRAALAELRTKGVRLFGMFREGLQVGFIAVEKSNDDLFYIEKLSVLPGYRHHSYGGQLLRFAFDLIKADGGSVVSIGIIDGHAVLKQWYKDQGFQEKRKQHFDNLPFTVCFMEKKMER
ncbi:MAG TPA: GNAT family N-acetyltransferase [Spirochaetota bacterium]|nr:GNAT family N-acetyltransferase [Spirochaetota bacterium]HPL16506.1 GNAT family N-acetyltransferase [Spirochaetota bacterium]HQF09221.1 GNAT family N-acetyltransferase [Spirochaetota bacterium]HQH97762.1 GNAT family N-acetyltransferase [Spirochaetota bacterium]HQJ71465.1 GNAT family N-acetyltransferase [Spirochaetota bacterium]